MTTTTSRGGSWKVQKHPWLRWSQHDHGNEPKRNPDLNYFVVSAKLSWVMLTIKILWPDPFEKPAAPWWRGNMVIIMNLPGVPSKRIRWSMNAEVDPDFIAYEGFPYNFTTMEKLIGQMVMEGFFLGKIPCYSSHKKLIWFVEWKTLIADWFTFLFDDIHSMISISFSWWPDFLIFLA